MKSITEFWFIWSLVSFLNERSEGINNSIHKRCMGNMDFEQFANDFSLNYVFPG